MTKLRQVLFWSELCLWCFALCCFVLLCLFNSQLSFSLEELWFNRTSFLRSSLVICALYFLGVRTFLFLKKFGDLLSCIVMSSARVVTVLVSSFDSSCWTKSQNATTTKKTNQSACKVLFWTQPPNTDIILSLFICWLGLRLKEARSRFPFFRIFFVTVFQTYRTIFRNKRKTNTSQVKPFFTLVTQHQFSKFVTHLSSNTTVSWSSSSKSTTCKTIRVRSTCSSLRKWLCCCFPMITILANRIQSRSTSTPAVASCVAAATLSVFATLRCVWTKWSHSILFNIGIKSVVFCTKTVTAPPPPAMTRGSVPHNTKLPSPPLEAHWPWTEAPIPPHNKPNLSPLLSDTTAEIIAPVPPSLSCLLRLCALLLLVWPSFAPRTVKR